MLRNNKLFFLDLKKKQIISTPSIEMLKEPSTPLKLELF
jgi:hypothetical protein